MLHIQASLSAPQNAYTSRKDDPSHSPLWESAGAGWLLTLLVNDCVESRCPLTLLASFPCRGFYMSTLAVSNYWKEASRGHLHLAGAGLLTAALRTAQWAPVCRLTPLGDPKQENWFCLLPWNAAVSHDGT